MALFTVSFLTLTLALVVMLALLLCKHLSEAFYSHSTWCQKTQIDHWYTQRQMQYGWHCRN